MVRVAINGFGRIGRQVFQAGHDDAAIDFVAFNDLTDTKTLAHLLKYDSVHGKFKGTVEAKPDGLVVNGKFIKVLSERDPAKLPWKDLGVYLAVESTGLFREREKANWHLQAGANKVLISAPAKGPDITVVLGVNHEKYDHANHNIISNASCTTNCVSPVAKVLNDNFELKKALMTTTHAYTNDQNTLDGPHAKPITARRGRAAAANIVPTSTGAAVAVGKVLPQLAGKLDGMALRVPTVTGSVVDLVVELGKNVTVEEINAAMKAASNETLGYTEDPIVSADVIGTEFGSLFDALSTSVMEVEGKQLVKIITWYDNEMSYTAQLVRLAKKIATM